MRTVHFHIGADSLFSEYSTELNSILESRHIPSNLEVMSEEDFVSHFKHRIAGARPADGDEILGQYGYSTNDVLISRPKILYTGQPMTAPRSVHKALYKIDAIQNIFSNCKIVFHLVISDQVSYLNSHLKWLERNSAPSVHTWRGLRDAIVSRIVSPNQLIVWNAEDALSGKIALTSFLLKATDHDTLEAAKKFGTDTVDHNTDHRAVEENLTSIGVNIELLDDEFEKDLDAMQLHHPDIKK